MSNPRCDTQRMNNKKNVSYATPANLALPRGHRVIARFGPACLVRKPNGRHELIGGTAEQCFEAREWCSLFAPEIVFASAPPQPGALVLTA